MNLVSTANLLVAILLLGWVHVGMSNEGEHTSSDASTGKVDDDDDFMDRNITSLPEKCRPGLAAEASRRFAYEFFRKTAAKNPRNKNLFTAPTVVGTGLAMILAGAKEETREQLIRGLQLDKMVNFTDHQLTCLLKMYSNDVEMQSLKTRLKDEDSPERPSSPNPISLMTAARLFGEKSFVFSETFLQQTKNYGSSFETVNFSNETELSRQMINDWVAQQTGDTIKDLFSEDAIKTTTKLVVVSAIYFKGTWKIPFKERLTFESNFNTNENTQVPVKFMDSRNYYRWFYSESLRSDFVELPYEDDVEGRYNISMVLIVPNGFNLSEVMDNVSEDVFKGIIPQLMSRNPMNLRVVLPKFKIEAEYNLQPILRDMDVKYMFNPKRANLDGMVDVDNRPAGLHVSSGVHKTFIEVDEIGTVASGAAGFTIVPLSIPITVRCDKPFLVMIYEKKSDTVLFMGKVGNPSISG